MIQLHFEESSESVEITLEGDMTIRWISDLKKLIDELPSSSKKIIVNLEKVRQIDTSGIQFMIAWKKKVESEHKILKFRNHSPKILSLIDLYGLVGFFGDKLYIAKKDKNLYSFAYGRKKGLY